MHSHLFMYLSVYIYIRRSHISFSHPPHLSSKAGPPPSRSKGSPLPIRIPTITTAHKVLFLPPTSPFGLHPLSFSSSLQIFYRFRSPLSLHIKSSTCIIISYLLLFHLHFACCWVCFHD